MEVGHPKKRKVTQVCLAPSLCPFCVQILCPALGRFWANSLLKTVDARTEHNDTEESAVARIGK